ncbi:cobamide remodeling phosphodiesterase CbiR [Geotoga petraea]|jgi:sugar phosphate isomerase/epimerase|uniref:Sugar phosphate isomerase/epimerase n=1 Tax=Geotoga petraea TaxID=28234 RepID=A0A4Z0W0Y0_9BACT|nr:cobamide remodeling phosphodiesterase CbiR [Geotoga petraea]TGG86769.1 hypothetical protein E4650_09780 [Geotoga petraea]
MIVGMTSWQKPGTYLENVELLKGFADFVELLVYTWDETTKGTLEKEIGGIRNKVKYSVHLPTDNLENCKKAIQYFSDKNAYRLTIHPFGDKEEFRKVIKEGIELVGEKLCLENLENDAFYDYYEFVKDLEVSITMDYGHLLIINQNPQEFYEKYSGQIKEIHYHGVDSEKGHVFPEENQLEEFINFYDQNFEKDVPVCIELFELEDTKKVFERLKKR